ncbi:hypothetical protein LXT12_03545 [Pelomonas sp. P7]|uniref:Uncharacterized protein n=1 Tax=Pelomonas caseinilytica TaxID=2906763 RepID=A0ABS8XBQ7_9BURK|nr:hypothetical protein [Pelomonas sp. P7]MCE4536328.1 hypothetical protein [Pelomonas sp. P7]
MQTHPSAVRGIAAALIAVFALGGLAGCQRNNNGTPASDTGPSPTTTPVNPSPTTPMDSASTPASAVPDMPASAASQ